MERHENSVNLMLEKSPSNDSKDEAKISSEVFHSIGEHSNQCHCGEVDKDIRKDSGVGENFVSQNNSY